MGMFQSWARPSFTIKHPGVRKRVVSLAQVSRNGYNRVPRAGAAHVVARRPTPATRETLLAPFSRATSPPAFGAPAPRRSVRRRRAHFSPERAAHFSAERRAPRRDGARGQSRHDDSRRWVPRRG